eukprot:1276198-Amphidinium_carterae.1
MSVAIDEMRLNMSQWQTQFAHSTHRRTLACIQLPHEQAHFPFAVTNQCFVFSAIESSFVHMSLLQKISSGGSSSRLDPPLSILVHSPPQKLSLARYRRHPVKL